MKSTIRNAALILAIVLIAACSRPAADAPAQAPSASAPVAQPVPPAGTKTQPPAMADALLACLASDRAKWLAGALSEADLAQMWGDLGWIQGIKDPVLQKRYQAVFDLSAGQHTVSAQKLMAALNAQAGEQAPAQAKEIDGFMRQQYAADVPADSDEVDAEFRAALAASAAQLKQVRPILDKVSEPWRPYADLAVEGVVYSDAFAQVCAIQALRSAPKQDQVSTEQAAVKAKSLMSASVKPASAE